MGRVATIAAEAAVPAPRTSAAAPLAGRITTLQMFRGLAAVLVLLYHVTVTSQEQLGYSFLHGLFLFGYTGVDFFFVLSGFIIYYIHIRDLGHPDRLRSYAGKRLARIFPIYWVVTGIKLVLIFIIPTLGVDSDRNFGVIVNSLLLLPQRDAPVIPAAWTLSYELLFYVLFGLAILLGSRWAYRLVWVWIVVTVGYNCAVLFGAPAPGSLWLQLVLNERNLEFCLGCLSAHLVINHKVTAAPLLVAAGLLLFGVAAVRIDLGYVPTLYTPVFGVASFLIVSGVAAYELLNRLVVPRALVYLGDASYSVYLTHVMAINAFVFFCRKLNVASVLGGFGSAVSTIILVVGATCLFYTLVERPLLRGLSWRLRAPRAGP